MLMSIFSSFDALCSESLGQKVSLSWVPGGGNKEGKQQGSPPVVNSERISKAAAGASSSSSVNGVGDGPSSLPSSHSKKPEDHHQPRQQMQRRPRFAVELDGVHCFETIIPY